MIETTIGNILINEKLPADMRDYSRVITGKSLGALAAELGRKHPEDYGRVIKDLKDLGDEFSTQLGSSFSMADFKPNAQVDKIYSKYSRQYAAINKLSESSATDDKRRAVNLKAEGEINALVDKQLQSDSNRFTMWGKAGAKGGATNFRQMLYASGNQVDVKKELFPHMSKHSLSQGLTPSDFFITSLGARTGVVGSFNSVKEPGAYAKELYSATNDLIVTSLDCGDTEGSVMDITNPDILDRYLAAPQMPFKRNDLTEGSMLDILRAKKVTQLHVRTPIHCKMSQGICSKCYGPNEAGVDLKVGETVGLSRAQSIAEPLTQLALSAKHSGGVVGKKSAFEQVTQLFHAPENFPGGAVITHVTGIITKVEAAHDGGTNVYVGDTLYYLNPKQKPLVKKGEAVKRAQALSIGLVNPKEYTSLVGIIKGREYLAKAVRATYKDNGVDSHAKVFETIVRATMNHGEVEDTGDYGDELDIKEIVSWERTKEYRDGSVRVRPVYNCIGWRLSKSVDGFKADTVITDTVYNKLKGNKELEVYKIPAKIKPIMISTEQVALGKDFISAMNYRNIKRVLEKAVTTGGEADIHGLNPSTAYAYGAEMRHGPDGTF